MGDVIDLTAEPDHDILHSTEAGGLFGSGNYLQGEPLAAYLQGREEPKYALQNKKSGLTVAGESERGIVPDSGFQTLAVVTDIRIVFVAGQSDGDESRILPLTDIVGADVEKGLRTNTLSIETLANETWQFASRNDPSAVAEYIEDAAQVWANAVRLLDDLEEVLETAAEYVSAGQYDRAKDELSGTESTIQTAQRRIAEVGPGASEQVAERGGQLRDRLDEIRRELTAQRAALAHGRAQDHWQESEYEAAADAYDSTLELYEEALDTDGPVPPEESLWARHRAAIAERELLRVGPIVDADTSRRRAVALADPEDAAAEWETALEGYRELLGLDWGTTDGEFVADREVIREQTTAIADDAISDHREAGKRWLHSGDKLAVQDREKQAEQVYERARHQFEQARQLSNEVRPNRIEEVDRALEAVESRLDGDTPTTVPPDDPIAFDPTSETESEATADSPDGLEDIPFRDSERVTSHAPEPPSSTDSATRHRESEDSSPSVLEKIQAQKRASVSGTESDDPPRTNSTDAETDPRVVPSEIDELDEEQFTLLVAELWEAEGWMTTVFEAGETVYDIVAMREEPEERLLLWSRHGTETSKTAIKQCKATLESSRGSDDAVLVTTDTLTKAARRQADELGVTVVEREELLERLEKAAAAGSLDIDYGESPHA